MGFDCQILLDNPTKIYFSGDTIRGNVLVVSDSPKSVKGLSVKFIGKANVRFQERETRTVRNPHLVHSVNTYGSIQHNHGHHNRVEVHGPSTSTESVSVTYDAHEDYLTSVLNLFGNDGNEVTVEKGRYSYPFSFQLPQGLPSSMEGRHGSVSYYIESVLGRSWAFDCKAKVIFGICGLVDLNREPLAQQPMESRKTKTFGFFCCESGPLAILLRLSKVGYVPGEFIQFLLDINNNSDQNVKGCLYLIQTITYHAKGRSKSEIKIVAQAEGQLILPGDSDIWQGNILRVPQTPPTNLGGCRLINVGYELKVEMKYPGMSSNLTTSIPIIIGTKPFIQGQRSQNLQPVVHGASVQAYPQPPPLGFQAGQQPPMASNDYKVPYETYDPPPPYNPNM